VFFGLGVNAPLQIFEGAAHLDKQAGQFVGGLHGSLTSNLGASGDHGLLLVDSATQFINHFAQVLQVAVYLGY